MIRSDSTIAAISTAPGAAGIGIVRISGPEAFKIAERIFHAKNNNMESFQSHTIHYGWIYDGKDPVDEVLLMIMKSPHTYTGEDTIEIDCHGGIYSTRRVLDTVLSAGASIAEPGEFTKRAFLNGRIDLSRAEAVMDLISAKNEYALQSSIQQLKGSVFSEVQVIRKELLHEIAYIESALDDPEHMSLDGFTDRLSEVVKREKDEISSLLSRSKNGKLMKEGITTVIIGKPNAGKSSLLNYMVGEEKAIVTDIAGTTRDTLDEYINLDGITLHLVDTAGIRQTEDVIEKIGVEKALKAADEADLIIYVMDSSAEFDESDRQILDLLKDKKVIILYNKTDLQSKSNITDIKEYTSHPIVPVSLKEKTGITDFENIIKDMFFDGKISINDELYITNLRHIRSLQDTLECLILVEEGIQDEMPEDLLSIDLRDACDHLGSITGETVGEDLVNEIFSSFCMGK